MRRHKYGAVASGCHEGHKHPSKREAIRCDELHLLQACGQIANLAYEPQFHFTINGRELKFPNGRRAGFKPDFGYTENGVFCVEDIKSKATMTEAFMLRAALFRHLFPEIELRIVQ